MLGEPVEDLREIATQDRMRAAGKRDVNNLRILSAKCLHLAEAVEKVVVASRCVA
jgi:hypothetical protein